MPATVPETINPADILTPQEVAKRLKVSVTWIYENRRSKKGRLPARSVGRYLRFYWPEVCQWWSARKEGAR
jgi:excisionase family DNA binding protein